MKTSELNPNTVEELSVASTIEDGEGFTVLIGDSTAAYRGLNGDWFVAEGVVWDRVEDYHPQRAHLEALAEKWILAHGTDVEMGMTDDIANELELEPEFAADVFQLIRKAAVTITFG